MPKSSEAWKKLVASHRKGPKRVRIHRPRKKNGVPALANPENIKKIQIVQNDGFKEKHMGLVVFKGVFASMNLKQSGVYTMPRNQLNRTARLFKSLLDEFSHNDYILGRLREKKLTNKIGKCVIFTGKIKEPDATFQIMPVLKKKTQNQIKFERKNREKIRQMFEKNERNIENKV